MPTTPRTASSHYSSTNAATPRSSRRLTTSFNTPSRLPLTQPPELPALPPLNTKKYPERPYAEDHEFTQLLQQDMLQVDEAVEMLSHSTEEVRRQLRENLTHLESEKLAYQNKIKELGEVAKEMVKTQGKEREELEGAKRKEEEVARQQAKLKVRLEGYQQEVKEALAKLNQRKNRMDLSLVSRFPILPTTDTSGVIHHSESETESGVRISSICQQTRTRFLRTKTRTQD